VGRYPFDVELFHLLLQAGLSRRFPKAEWRSSSSIYPALVVAGTPHMAIVMMKSAGYG